MSIDDMRWPTLRHRLCYPRFFKWPAYNGFGVNYRNSYYGHWLLINFGWFAFQMGSGEYITTPDSHENLNLNQRLNTKDTL